MLKCWFFSFHNGVTSIYIRPKRDFSNFIECQSVKCQPVHVEIPFEEVHESIKYINNLVVFSDKDSHSGYKDIEGSIYVDLPRIRKWVLILMSPNFFFSV